MLKWFHHLFNPHCKECAEEKVCASCETLRSLLEQSQFEKRDLLNRLLQSNEKTEEPRATPENLKPIMPRHVPWRVRQQMLEEESRNRARSMTNAAKPDTAKTETYKVEPQSIDELERELGVVDTHEG